jgi:polynucleotide 5'-hydroxyl-kinase GRC3/NOL9
LVVRPKTELVSKHNDVVVERTKLIDHKAVSAFAARQRLWGAKPQESVPVEPAEENQEEASSAQDVLLSRPASSRKRKTKPQEEPLPSSNAATNTERATGSQAAERPSLQELSSEGLQK